MLFLIQMVIYKVLNYLRLKFILMPSVFILMPSVFKTGINSKSNQHDDDISAIDLFSQIK